MFSKIIYWKPKQQDNINFALKPVNESTKKIGGNWCDTQEILLLTEKSKDLPALLCPRSLLPYSNNLLQPKGF